MCWPPGTANVTEKSCFFLVLFVFWALSQNESLNFYTPPPVMWLSVEESLQCNGNAQDYFVTYYYRFFFSFVLCARFVRAHAHLHEHDRNWDKANSRTPEAQSGCRSRRPRSHWDWAALIPQWSLCLPASVWPLKVVKGRFWGHAASPGHISCTSECSPSLSRMRKVWA